jgi:aryl-alcohol dehydrogenase-like predicted oxidoreductase
MTTTTTSDAATDRVVDLAPDIVLDAMNFGTTFPEGTAFAILDAFAEAGGTAIDTADCSAFWTDPTGVGGATEEVIGRWAPQPPGRRSADAHLDEGRSSADRSAPLTGVRRDCSPRPSAPAWELCLRRLRRDHVDLLWAHTASPSSRRSCTSPRVHEANS